MSKRSQARRRQREAKAARQIERREPWRRLPLKALIGWGSVAVVGALFAALLISGVGGGGSAEENPQFTSLASQLAAGGSAGATEQDRGSSDIRVFSGSGHTVYHSTQPLPSVGAPRDDGKPTLVWFSGTWCSFCERMEPWALETAGQFSDRMAFVEKSVDHDRSAASRYGIRGTPTFVLIDDPGNEVVRFHYQGNAGDFQQAIEAALAQAGA